MTTAADVIYQLASLGATIRPDAGQLRLGAPTRITDQHRQLVKKHRDELLAYFAQQEAAAVPATLEPIFFDLETRSHCDLKKFGGRVYSQHRTTEVLSMVAIIDNVAIVWFPTLAKSPPAAAMTPAGCPPNLIIATFSGVNLPAPLADAIAAGRPLCAHNAFDFDRQVWQAQGWPEPTNWLDTLHAARAACLPGKLDQLGRRLLGHGKDEKGEQVMKALITPNRDGLFRPLSQENAILLGRYNLLDVIICREIYTRYYDCVEPEVLAMDQAINARGIMFDTKLAAALIQLAKDAAQQKVRQMERITKGGVKGKDLNRQKFLLARLNGLGLRLPNLKRETIQEHLNREALAPEVRAVLEGRITISRNSAKKLETGLLHVDGDGRLRHQLVYHKAHTGRWAGRGMQPQNLPRPHKRLGDVLKLIPEVADLAKLKAKLPAGVAVDDAISALIRPCFRAAKGKAFVIADFSAIEARGVAWCAGDTKLVAQFARGEDVYAQFASELFGRRVSKRDERERTIGKVAVLSCGYGIGEGGFERKCIIDRVNLAKVGLTAKQVVDGYRDAHPAIAGEKIDVDWGEYRRGGLWKNLEAAARTAIETGESQFVAYCSIERVGVDLVVRLPSGRRMFFRDAKIDMIVPSYVAKLGLPPEPKPTILYSDNKNNLANLYGGKITENIVSAICRDLQVGAMLRLEKMGLPIVLHVHDEIVVEVAKAEAAAALETVLKEMSTPPSWAAGFPVQAEGFVSPRYVKSPPTGAYAREARNGKLLVT